MTRVRAVAVLDSAVPRLAPLQAANSPLLWRGRPRARGRALLDVLAAVASSVLILMVAGAVVDAETVPAALFLPVVISGSVVAVTANRMVNQPSAGPNASR